VSIYYPFNKAGASSAAVQRITRQSEGFEHAYHWTKGRKMAENWRFEYSVPTCTHNDKCGCLLKVRGVGKDTSGLAWQGKTGTVKEQIFDAAIWMDTWAKTQNGLSVQNTEQYFKAKLTSTSTMKLTDAPIQSSPVWPVDVVLPTPCREVQRALKYADFRYFQAKGMYYSMSDLEKYVWNDNPTEIRPLWAVAMRQLSMYYWVCGKTNGRPHAVSAMMGQYPRKLPDAVLMFDREQNTDRMKEALEFLEPSLATLYRLLGIDLTKKHEWTCSMQCLRDMYLGASSGQMDSEVKRIQLIHDEYVKVSNRGKKIDFHEQVLMQVYRFILFGEKPNVLWVLPPKNETFFEFNKQWNDDQWESFLQKLRLFNIPSSVYIYLERLVSLERHLLERGKTIRIGHKWSRGGAETLANCLGVGLHNCWKRCIIEGDFKKFDQSVRASLMKLYWSQCSVHFDQSSPDFPIMEVIIKFLLECAVYRVTHLFGKIWAIIEGSVASGKLNTSHEDSWIVAFLFASFLVYTVMTSPLDQQEELEAYVLSYLKLVCYGDDHLYNVGDQDKSWTQDYSTFFSGHQWSNYCKVYWSMDVRDLKQTSYCSTTRHGWLVQMGATFLKHQFVLNPVQGNGQSLFLPFRESREYLIRAVYSREPKERDVVDVMLSVMGQAHSTYASNRDAYDRLLVFYQELYAELSEGLPVKEIMWERIQGHDDMRKIRQMGLSPDELISGFPTWDKLVEKNVYDPVYQEISVKEIAPTWDETDIEGYY